MDDLKRHYELRETLLKAQAAEVRKWKKYASELEERLNTIDAYFSNLNVLQKWVAKLFRIGF